MTYKRPLPRTKNMQDNKRIGFLLTPELMKALHSLYPAKSPDPRDSDREIWIKAGERRVVEVLQSKFDEANEELGTVL